MQQRILLKQMNALLHQYEKMIESFEAKKASYPAGSLYDKVKNGNHYFYRIIIDAGKKNILPLKGTPECDTLIKELREKRVVLHGLPILRRNADALRNALKKMRIYDPEEYANGAFLADTLFLPGQLNTGKWLEDTEKNNFKTNPSHPEHLIFETSDGHFVRSKSELIIYEILLSLGLHFRYDSELKLWNGKTIYPDFIIYHPIEKKLIILEHFGKMDDPEYAMSNMLRLKEYAKSGYSLGRDLFFTIESKEQPLTKSQINQFLYESKLI